MTLHSIVVIKLYELRLEYANKMKKERFMKNEKSIKDINFCGD